MLTRRLVACFDVRDGRLTKARQFQDNVDVGDPVEFAARLYEDGIDEIVFYDITASSDRRRIDLGTVERVAERVFVPFTVGGGLRSVDDMRAVLKAGAEKVSIDSMAVRDPSLVAAGARAFGSQCVVVSMQVKAVEPSAAIPSGYEIAIDGARHMTGLDAVAWAVRAAELGAGELVVNSIDRDGTQAGYDLEITGMVAAAVNVPVVASGGAGTVRHVAEAFLVADAQAAIVSSMLYSPRLAEHHSVGEMKRELAAIGGVQLRPPEEATPLA
ncbi:MAG TPA: imidazole glycerol phosphate synthase cyclase subunit [Acidimicrobiales bacterium]|nr:imidazole glycerol phosphate synthase cyclase subunit [Acidimicrobiales bacterium]